MSTQTEAPTDVPTKTRITVDLDPQAHTALHVWRLTEGHGATMTAVIRTLIDRLATDPELAASIAAELTPDRRRKQAEK